jgi:hypothetical protein
MLWYYSRKNQEGQPFFWDFLFFAKKSLPLGEGAERSEADEGNNRRRRKITFFLVASPL